LQLREVLELLEGGQVPNEELVTDLEHREVDAFAHRAEGDPVDLDKLHPGRFGVGERGCCRMMILLLLLLLLLHLQVLLFLLLWLLSILFFILSH
jgi:hypothetical protein